MLAQFKEDSWNYPVTRIVDHFRKDLVARNANWRDRKGVIQQLVAGLKARNKTTPAYLELLALNDSARNNKYETAVFGMS